LTTRISDLRGNTPLCKKRKVNHTAFFTGSFFSRKEYKTSAKTAKKSTAVRIGSNFQAVIGDESGTTLSVQQNGFPPPKEETLEKRCTMHMRNANSFEPLFERLYYCGHA
jgi:hypothetical protein